VWIEWCELSELVWIEWCELIFGVFCFVCGGLWPVAWSSVLVGMLPGDGVCVCVCVGLACVLGWGWLGKEG
jgi:hypothetical protein